METLQSYIPKEIWDKVKDKSRLWFTSSSFIKYETSNDNNNNVININSISDKNIEYNQLVSEVCIELRELEETPRDRAIIMGLSKAYREWSEEQPIGTVVNFTEDMFWECGDEKVIALLELRKKVLETIEFL